LKLLAYPRTKPSGVEWLGDVPEHWIPIALRRTSTRYAGGTPDRSNDSYWDEGTIPWINSGSVNQGLITEPSTFISEEAYRSSSARWVAKGALVMALAGQGKTKGMVAQTGIATTCNQSMAAICPTSPTEARYLYWLLVSQYEHIRNMAGGEARDGLNLEILGSIPCLKVPPAEQRAIAAFLDRETGRMDRLVAKKRELIERLKEKRTALISRTVTRGLPSAAAGLPGNPPVKPSGVDWLGDVPKHWDVVPLGYLVRFSGGATPDKSNFAYWDGSIPWVSPKDMKVARIADSEDHVSPEALDNSALRLMPVDSVLIVVRGMILAHSFPVARTTAPVTINQDMKAVACGKRLTPHFLSWSFTGFAKTFVSFADESAHGTRKLEAGTLTRFPFLLPPLPEQAAIAAYLDKETAKLDALVRKVGEAVERLQEYRTALITAAVTGKIDVRNTTP
jgi:type I restriction enzyme S subunit